MKTDLIQTIVVILNDDHGVSALAYYNMKQLIADQLGEKVANRFGNIVDSTNNRFNAQTNRTA